jgi:putative membrane protein
MNDSDRPERIPSTEDLAHFARGVLMGGADIIPGVSGGTVALILGIYARLVNAISHCDRTLLKLLRQGHWRDAAEHLDLRFLVPLAIGIGGGVAALGTVMHALLEEHLQLTLAAFFGLIAGSCFLVSRLVARWRGIEVLLAVSGAAFALWLVTRPALASPPDALWYIFLCGAVAICAMILPGISGAFILLILGEYHEITGIIKDGLKLQWSVDSLVTVAVFASGCVVGLLSFSKLLRWLLSSHGSQTMAVLCGFMAGSLYKIWPFQRDTTPEVEQFKHKVFQPISLNEIAWDGMFAWTLLAMLLSAAAVILLDRLGRRSPR